MENREALEKQIRQLEDEADQYRRAGNEAMCNAKLVEAMEKREELDRMSKEAIIADAQSPDTSFSLESDGFIADFRALAAGEDEYQMLSVTTQLYISRLVQAHAAEVNKVKEIEDQKYAAIEAELDQTRSDLLDVRGKLETSMNQITDIEIERDNAVKEADLFKREAEELRSQATKPSGPTNLDGASSLAEINARIEAKKIPVYDKKDVFRSNDGTYTTFKIAGTGEYGEIIWTSFNAKYRVVTEDEAARFQSELEAAKADIPDIAEPVQSDLEVIEEPTIEPPTFRETDTTLQEHTVHGEVDADATPVDGGRRENEEWEAWVERTLSNLGNRMTALDYQANEMPPSRKVA